MKKIIALTVLAGLLLAGTSFALVSRSPMAETRLTTMSVNIRYARGDLNTIEAITISGSAIVLDDVGATAGTFSTRANWNDLPAARKLELKTFLQFISRQVNNQAVAEDVEQTLPDVTP